MRVSSVFKVRRAKDYPIFHIVAPNQHILGMMFMRFQEHYESSSSKLRDKYFTWEEAMNFFALKCPDAVGHFHYIEEVRGYNVPGNHIQQVGLGFRDLTKAESKLIELLQKEGFNMLGDEPSYVIASYQPSTTEEKIGDATWHELCHALFYCNEDYRKVVKRIVRKYERAGHLKGIHKILKEQGYSPVVYLDEVHAYALDNYCVGSFKITMTRQLENMKKELFQELAPFLPKGQRKVKNVDNFFNKFTKYTWKYV